MTVPGGEAACPPPGDPTPARPPLLRLGGVSKRYGPTRALDGVNLALHPGEIVGVIGHNGAGKSTLMRTVMGLTRPDGGTVTVDGNAQGPGYDLKAAQRLGFRIVFQELSLAPSLRVYENAVVARPSARGRGWRRRTQAAMRASLDEIFPGNRVSARSRVGGLALAQQQMVEIAEACLGGSGEIRLLVLDEPTSSLGKEPAEALFRHLRRLREQGTCVVFISHRLSEVIAITDRIVVMRDGRVAGERESRQVSEPDLVSVMGAGPARAAERASRAAHGEPVLVARGLSAGPLDRIDLVVHRGELVGLAGLDGQGQHELLVELWRRRHGRGRVRAASRVAFVTGDRQSSGVFPLWDLRANMSVASLRALARLGVIRPGAERALADRWVERLAIRGRPASGILELSGGTQQKVLLARALATAADLVLLDDPFRGVDVATKRDTYLFMHEEAKAGRSFVWFSTENAELEECDRVYVLHGGRVVSTLAGQDVSEQQVVAASFAAGQQSPAQVPAAAEDGQ
jgi:ribose transport system ATP-binding protein